MNTQTKPTLQAINHTGPVRFRELGTGGKGIDWTVQPENMDAAIAMVNKHGGPGMWEITAL